MQELNPQEQATQDVETVKEELVAANPNLELKPKPTLPTESIDENIKEKIKELSKLRKSISLDLKKIADQTKISTNQLKNIEAFNFHKLPPNTMRTSFINQYCLEIERNKK